MFIQYFFFEKVSEKVRTEILKKKKTHNKTTLVIPSCSLPPPVLETITRVVFFFFIVFVCIFSLLTGKETEYSHKLKKNKIKSRVNLSASENEEITEKVGKNHIFKGFPYRVISIFIKETNWEYLHF